MVNHRRENGTRFKILRCMITLIIAIALAKDNAIGRLNFFFPVEAFQTKSTRTVPRVISSIAGKSRGVITVPSSQVYVATSTTGLFMAPGNNKIKNSDSNEEEAVSPVFWKDLQKKPGNLIMLPFIALFGFDLVINIVFLSKRAVEYFVFGTVPSSEPWW
mmetsp:Transcript_8353/g.20627  ORF Transcript_8353/g.20627 Transcript_8353/m.20627 type:complete len:160 (+) Transcript_8353:130-609(+)